MLRLFFGFSVLLAALSAIGCFPANDIDNTVVIKPNTPENIEKLKSLGKDDLAEELSGQYQGDLILSPAELREYESSKKGKTGLIARRYQWAGAVVPVKINASHFNQEQYDYILVGMKRIEEETCIRFVEYNENVHNDFVSVIGSGSGCYSSVGRRGTGEQFLNLQPSSGLEVGCFRLYTIVHEFFHALGFYHMQSATERDEYVEIVWDKIQAGTANNFNTYGYDVITNYGVEYDYGSMMHYSSRAFSIDGSDTIIPLKPLNGETMGQRLRMSEKDIARLNRAYCEGIVETTTQSKPSPTPHPIIQSINDFINNLLKNILASFRP